jgi:hypothetical protein
MLYTVLNRDDAQGDVAYIKFDFHHNRYLDCLLASHKLRYADKALPTVIRTQYSLTVSLTCCSPGGVRYLADNSFVD